MASLLDISLIESASTIFAFLLVLAISYSVMTSVNFIKVSKFNATVMSISVSMLVLFTPGLLNAIKLMIPWFGVIIAFIIFILIALFTLGYTNEDLKSTLASRDYGMQIKAWIIVIGSIVFIASLASQFSVFTGEEAAAQEAAAAQEERNQATVNALSPVQVNNDAIDEKGEDALIATLFHPKMLGMIALMMIAVFAAIFLSTSNK